MATPDFQRARSREAKDARRRAILDVAAELAAARGVRSVTLTDIAAAVGMHKSAMLRYFETREQIFLLLAGEGWHEWSGALSAELGRLPGAVDGAGARPDLIAVIAETLVESLVSRRMFCDLLAQAPLNLERNVSLESVRSFKLIALAEVGRLVESLRRLLPLTLPDAYDTVATATSMAGALWQMAVPGANLRELYKSAPELSHAVVDVGPRLFSILAALLTGFCASVGPASG